MCFHAAVSSPEGPAAPSILRTVLRISSPSILSNRTGWGSTIGASGVTMDDCFGDCFGGCFFERILRTVSGVVLRPSDPIWLSSCSGPPLLSSAISRSAALTLPSIIISATNRFGVCLLFALKTFQTFAQELATL